MTKFEHAGVQRRLEEAAASGAVPGVVAVVTGPGGLLYEGTAGRVSVERDALVTADTMFRIASMTKALVSVAALQLVEEGRLELGQPVASVLPAFGELQVLEGFDGDTPRLRPPARQATIRHLLTHTSGHGYFFGSPELVRYHELTGVPDPISGLRASLHTPLLFDPGAAWNYGINTDWLGQVIEAVTGQALDVRLAERVTGPLGMSDTTFDPTPEQRARLMPVHARTPVGGLALAGFEWQAAPEFWAGGHGGHGTARDYARFLAMLLAGGTLDGERILRPESVALAFSDHLDGIALPEVMETTRPDLVCPIPALPWRQGWGLGFHLTLEDLPGMRRAGTGDWSGIFNSYFWVDRASGLAAALFTQLLPFFDERVVELLVGFEQDVYAGVGAAAPA